MTTLSAGAGIGSTMNEVFAVRGRTMRAHRGRSVVCINVDGRPHYLKRFWLTPRQVFKRCVSRGLHELKMIDWLSAHGFEGPKVVARGRSGPGPFATRLFFLMEEVPDELDLERYHRAHPGRTEELVAALAEHTARLHQAGFYHYDYLATHILTGESDGRLTFRLIDVERARVDSPSVSNAATDLNKLLTSVGIPSLRGPMEESFVDTYLAHLTAPPDKDVLLQRMSRSASSKRYRGK